MCGRKTLTKDKIEIIANYLVEQWEKNYTWKPSFNIAPTQITPILLHDQVKKVKPMRWGLIPHWADDMKIGNKMINARSETLTEKRTFSNLLKQRRCVIITDGYYEWKKEKNINQPYYIHIADNSFLSMAGLWSTWIDQTGKKINSYTVITTTPQKGISHIHKRMPVILTNDETEVWLNCEEYSKDIALELLKPFEQKLEYYRVSNIVNSPINNSSKCIKQKIDNELTLF